MIVIANGAESLLVWNSHVRASEAKTCLELTCMQVCEATWEGKESKYGVGAVRFDLVS